MGQRLGITIQGANLGLDNPLGLFRVHSDTWTFEGSLRDHSDNKSGFTWTKITARGSQAPRPVEPRTGQAATWTAPAPPTQKHFSTLQLHQCDGHHQRRACEPALTGEG